MHQIFDYGVCKWCYDHFTETTLSTTKSEAKFDLDSYIALRIFSYFRRGKWSFLLLNDNLVKMPREFSLTCIVFLPFHELLHTSRETEAAAGRL